MICNPHQVSFYFPFCGASTPFRVMASLYGASRLHSLAHHTRQDSLGRVIGPI